MSEYFLSIEGVSKVYPPQTIPVFEEVSFGIQKGEFMCIVGHAGCGKTTLLNMMAGLESPTTGVVRMGGRVVTGPSLDRGIVFQDHSLLPWLNVLENVVFAVKSRRPGLSKEDLQTQAMRFIGMVGLEGSEHKMPAELSGGMKQRVGVARAFSIEPKMLFLDEPFGALDALARASIQDALLKICEATHQTVFMVTHDVDEAILLADKILLMSNGPYAHVAEIVVNTMPQWRDRTTMHRDSQYYAIRNHMVDFLLNRSRLIQAEGRSRKRPDMVMPGLERCELVRKAA